MSELAIRVENLGKMYHIGALQQAGGAYTYKSLRETITDAASAPFRAARGLLGGKVAPKTPDYETIWALQDVSFEVKRGEIVGVIGRNGAGKSTLLKVMSRITEPTVGRAEIHGRIGSLLEVGTGFHPELTGRDNVFLNGAILGMKRAEIARQFDEIVAFAEVERFIDTPVKHYSSGMYLRLAFAVAAHLEPEILIVDEVLAVGDARFQKKCIGKMQDFSEKHGRTILFVSHNLQAIRQLCGRALVLERGGIIFSGDVSTGISQYAGMELNRFNSAWDLEDYPRSAAPDAIRLTRVEFLDQNGDYATHVQRSSELRVNVEFVLDRQVNELDIPMAVIHVEGQRIFSERYSDQFGTLDLPPGHYKIGFSIPLRFLKLESYSLTVAGLEATRVCDHVEGLALPEIVDKDADPHIETHRWGLVRIPVTWSAIQHFA
jgi:lipopolysaccharide transport system ATP-binding protein